jgi:phage gp36-like protein
MPYCTVQDVVDAIGETRLRQILDVGNSADLDTNMQLLSAISQASATVDAFLRGVYQLPILGDDAILTGATRDLARYILISNHRVDILTEADRDAKNDAKAMLEKLNKREITLTWPTENRMEAVISTNVVEIGESTREANPNRVMSTRWIHNW